MFFLNKKKSIISSGLLDNFVDIHCHIMFGVDDGIQTLDETLKALSFYESHNVQKIYFTPHVMEDYIHISHDFLKSRFEEVKKAYKGNIDLYLGAEYMLDTGFNKHLDNEQLLTVADGKILVETYLATEFMGLTSKLYDIQAKGYDIILAHPERYNYMTMTTYKQLKERRIYFQLNLLSLLGIYGKSVRENAKKLLYNNMYDFTGSDMHNLKSLTRHFNKKVLKDKDIQLIKALMS